MTQELQTFLFADLAGYTALTEALGDETAADIAVTFCRELNRLLPPGAQDLKSLGDACMVRVPDASEAVALAVALVEDVAADRDFPRVRVGMHTGPATRRGSDWFGATVNVAARVAARAAPGQVLLSDTTHDLADGLVGIEIEPKGPTVLRHVLEPIGVWAARRSGAPRATFALDPVCQMRLRDPLVHRIEVATGLFFCSDACARTFAADPSRFTSEEPASSR